MELLFDNPGNLYFLLIIPFYIVLHFVFAKYSKRRAFLFANFKALKRVSNKYSLNTHTSLLIIRLFVILCLVFTLSQAKISFEAIGDTSNYIIALDNSYSMSVGDNDLTRIYLGKQAINNFVNDLSYETKVGIITFSSVSSIEYPLDYKSDELDEIIRRISINQDMGTNIGDAIYTGVNLLQSSIGSKRMILLTDGQSNSGSLIDTAVKYAKDENIQIFTIGITDEDSITIENGLNFTLNVDELKNIANYTGGEYFQINDNSGYSEVFNKIKDVKMQIITIELSEILLMMVLFLLVVEFVFIKTIYKITP